MIVAVTGHRPSGMRNLLKTTRPYSYDYRRFIALLRDYIRTNHVTRLNIGMAQGFDQLMAFAAIQEKISFDAYVPFLNQEAAWAEAGRFGKLEYKMLVSHAANVYISGAKYDKKLFTVRDRLMVDKADAVIALLDPDRRDGGTYYTVQYANKNGKQVVNLWEYLRDYL